MDARLIKCLTLPDQTRVYTTLPLLAEQTLSHLQLPSGMFVIFIPFNCRSLHLFSYYLHIVHQVTTLEERQKPPVTHCCLVFLGSQLSDSVCDARYWRSVTAYFKRHKQLHRVKNGMFRVGRTWVKVLSMDSDRGLSPEAEEVLCHSFTF